MARFGGHETFAVRPGWLSRGLQLVKDEPQASFEEPETADTLGVGRNMAKAIWHWLQVTGLVTRRPGFTAAEPTGLGKLVLRHDPYLQHTATWWALHVEVASHETAALTWGWFFGTFGRERFDRNGCVEELAAAVAQRGGRAPSARTLQRDVACLLQSYARPLPAEPLDPEDAADCPFRSLGLLVERKDVGAFERRFLPRDVPPELLGYTLAKLKGSAQGWGQIRFADALALPGGPGRLFCLDGNGLDELVTMAAAGGDVRSGLAGADRTIEFRRQPPERWLRRYYDRVRG